MNSVSFAELAPHDRYKLLCATIVPRPIALVTTLGPDGIVNARRRTPSSTCSRRTRP